MSQSHGAMLRSGVGVCILECRICRSIFKGVAMESQ